jgi:hypothetical protein
LVAWNSDAEHDLLAQLSRDSLSVFVRKVYAVDRNPKGTWWDWQVHEPLCTWLQAELLSWLARRKTVRERTYLAALLPRAAAKSNLITKAAMMWLHLHDQDLATYIANEKLSNAEDFLKVIKDHLSGQDDYSWWTWLYGSWRSDERRWRSDAITHAARRHSSSEDSFGITSVNTGLTGKHPDVLCLDDLVSYEGMSTNHGALDDAYDFVTNLIPVCEPNGLIIMIGTRYSDADPFGRSFAGDGIRSVSGMADPDYIPTKDGLWRVYFLSGRDADGRPAIPTVWSENSMKAYAKRDPIQYAFQCLNRPKANPFRPLTEAQFDACKAPNVPTSLRISIHGDTAFKHGDRVGGNSESAIVAIGHDQKVRGRLYFLGAWHSREWLDQDYTRQLLAVCRSLRLRGFDIRCITDELETSKAGVWEKNLRASFHQARERFPKFYTFDRKRGAAKDVRIFEAINMVTKGVVKFWDRAPGLATIREQLCNHPASARKDVADAFADCFHKDIYSAMLEQLAQKPDFEPGGWEEAAKTTSFWKSYDTLDEFDREPVGGAPGQPPARKTAWGVQE